jgi:hypothetical protein
MSGASEVFVPETDTGEEGRVEDVVVVVVVGVVLATGAGALVWADIDDALSNAAVTKLSLFRGVAILFMQKKECGCG